MHPFEREKMRKVRLVNDGEVLVFERARIQESKRKYDNIITAAYSQ